MNRTDLRRLAETRLQDAEILYASRRFSGSYYLAGYAIECALKACIARNTRRGDFPELKTVQRSYTHNLKELLGVAGLQPALDARAAADTAFARNWALVQTWSEVSRYESHSKAEARDLLEAISDSQSGVLPWLQTHW